MRKLILHYHLFKNAGTSVDEMLKGNFGARWVTREFEGPPAAVRAATLAWMAEQPDAVAFSSHTAILPPPAARDLRVFPVVFVRHPIDRIASAYAFERKQGADGFGAVLARHTSLAGYIEVRLSMAHDRQCRNFHVARLAQMFPPASGSEDDRALRAVEALPFVGIVEGFEASIAHMADWLRPHFPGIEPLVLARNVNRGTAAPLQARLDDVRREIGDELFGRLLAINAPDFAVYEAAQRKLGVAQEGVPALAGDAPVAPSDEAQP